MSAALTRKINNRQCPHGDGIAINTAEWRSRAADAGDDYPALAGAMLANGDTLVVASAAPTPTTATVAEFQTPCTLDTTFGDGGVVRLAMPGQGMNILSVYRTADGGALLAGGTSIPLHSHWLVGKLTSTGQLDPAFGRGGWTQLPWEDTATAIAVAHNGDLVVGGEGNRNGSSFITELTPHGRLVPTFGVGGRSGMPDWHDGGVQGVWIEPNGDILSLVGGGNMGCWSLVAVTLTPAGQRLSGFLSNFRRGLQETNPPAPAGYAYSAFIGDATIGPDGFHLIGTAQNNCVDNPAGRKPNPTQRVTNIAFGYDGNLDTGFGTNGSTSTTAPIADSAWALPQSDGSLLLVTSPDHAIYDASKHADLLAYRFTNTGDLDTSYGTNGVAYLPQPYRYSFWAVDPSSLPVTNGRQTAVIASADRGNAVIVLPVPTS